MMGGFGWKAAGRLGLELWMVCHILLLQTTDTGSFESVCVTTYLCSLLI